MHRRVSGRLLVLGKSEFHRHDLGSGKTPAECLAAGKEKCRLPNYPRVLNEVNCDGYTFRPDVGKWLPPGQRS